MGAPDDLDRLFSVGLSDFVAERKRLARALKDAGRGSEAKALDKTPRPTVAAWAVNQLARREPALVRQLCDLTERLAGAQRRMLSVGEAGPDYAADAAAHRRVVGELRARAEQLLGGAGHAPTPQLLARVVANLRAGAASPELRPLIERGQLSRDVEEQGFASVFGQAGAAESPGPRTPSPPRTTAGARTPPGARREPGTRASAARHAQETRAQRQREAAERERERALARAAARARAEAEREVKRLRAASAAAVETVEKLARAAGVAREALAEAEQRLTAARAKAEAAARDLQRAETARPR